MRPLSQGDDPNHLILVILKRLPWQLPIWILPKGRTLAREVYKTHEIYRCDGWRKIAGFPKANYDTLF